MRSKYAAKKMFDFYLGLQHIELYEHSWLQHSRLVHSKGKWCLNTMFTLASQIEYYVLSYHIFRWTTTGWNFCNTHWWRTSFAKNFGQQHSPSSYSTCCSTSHSWWLSTGLLWLYPDLDQTVKHVRLIQWNFYTLVALGLHSFSCMHYKNKGAT